MRSDKKGIHSRSVRALSDLLVCARSTGMTSDGSRATPSGLQHLHLACAAPWLAGTRPLPPRRDPQWIWIPRGRQRCGKGDGSQQRGDEEGRHPPSTRTHSAGAAATAATMRRAQPCWACPSHAPPTPTFPLLSCSSIVERAARQIRPVLCRIWGPQAPVPVE
jgi:hypothetical protein